MLVLILTNKGLEEAAFQEIKRLLGLEAEKKEGYLIINVTERKEIYKLAYLGRSFTRVLEVMSQGENPFEINYSISFSKEKTISVEVEREGEHEFNSADLYKDASEKLRKQGYNISKNPDIPLMLFVKDKNAYFCIDYCGFDTGKREYRIFTAHDAIKGNVAAGILLEADFSKGKTFFDPFCRDGIFAIESCLIAKNQSVHYYNKEKFAFLNVFDEDASILYEFDEIEDVKAEITASDTNFANISSAKKNATIATVVKDIRFLRCAIDDIDLKFDKEVDFIATMPLQPGRTVQEKIVEKVAGQFFNRAKEILNEDGKIVLVLKRGWEIYEKMAEGFELISKNEVMQGKEKVNILVMKKK